MHMVQILHYGGAINHNLEDCKGETENTYCEAWRHGQV